MSQPKYADHERIRNVARTAWALAAIAQVESVAGSESDPMYAHGAALHVASWERREVDDFLDLLSGAFDFGDESNVPSTGRDDEPLTVSGQFDFLREEVRRMWGGENESS